MSRVVVLFYGGQYASVCFSTQEEAIAYIVGWANVVDVRDPTNLPSTIRGFSPVDSKQCINAFVFAGIVGMYLATDELTPQERMASAIESAVKKSTEGDEWKEK